MTIIRDFDMKCSVCGETSSQRVLMSTNAFGSPDLDLRPPAMKRNTMNTWIFECPHCGYVAPKLEDETEIAKDFLKTDKYMTCDGLEFERELAGKFYKHYLISKETDNTYRCFLDLLYCAWVCDDADDVENAKKARKLAIGYLEQLIQSDSEEKTNYLLIKADLLRRSGEFDRVSEEYKDLIIGDELLDKIITFQVIKAKEGDDACYTVDDVVEQSQ